MEEKLSQEVNMQKDVPARAKRGISGSTLKIIAVVSMVIDHTAAGILGRFLYSSGLGSLDAGNLSQVQEWLAGNAQLFTIYNVMRMIGRIAFPIYCFLLVEGFEHTRDRMKYAARLLLFAAVSELPFDLLFKGSILEFSYQNVFFTLFFGVVVMMGIQAIGERFYGKPVVSAVLTWIVIAAGMAAAQFANTDYAAIGVFCIVVIYLCRKKKVWQIIAGCIVFSWEITAPLAFVPIGFYNGRRGWKLKYFFYLVYPVHLLILYLICMALGVASYPAM